MKTRNCFLLLAILCLFCSFFASCSSSDDDDPIDPTITKIKMDKAGTLSKLIPEKNITLIGDLTISGPMDANDFLFLHKMTGLSLLNMEDVNIVAGKVSSGAITLTTEVNILPMYAFSFLPITSIKLPQNIVAIKGGAFYRCEQLKEIKLPSSVLKVEDESFYQCFSLEIIHITGNLESITPKTFSSCRNIKEFITNNAVNFEAVDGVLYSKDKSILVIYPENKTDESYTTLTETKQVGSDAFYFNENIRSVILSDNVEEVGSHAFSNCTPLSSVVLSKKLKIIRNNAFFGCSFRSIILPESLELIEENPFSSWILKEIHFQSSTPPTIVTREDYNYYRIFIEADIYIPKGFNEAYQNAIPWDYYPNFKFIEE